MKVGRPTKYRKSFPEKAAKLWSRGATDAEVCKSLAVTHETLSQWCQRYAEFAAAKKASKAIADELVEQALFKRATGFIAPDCHISTHEGLVTVTPLKKHYPPDPVSMIFWLKNRKPREWRDKSELLIEQEVAGVAPEIVEGLRKRFVETVSKNGS